MVCCLYLWLGMYIFVTLHARQLHRGFIATCAYANSKYVSGSANNLVRMLKFDTLLSNKICKQLQLQLHYNSAAQSAVCPISSSCTHAQATGIYIFKDPIRQIALQDKHKMELMEQRKYDLECRG